MENVTHCPKNYGNKCLAELFIRLTEQFIYLAEQQICLTYQFVHLAKRYNDTQ